MSSNNIDTNIANAFGVIYATYENVEKLISYLQNLALEQSSYVSCTDKEYLRWNSEWKNTFSWANHSFILVFQHEGDVELESGRRDGPLFVIDIDLYDYGEAKIEIAKLEYIDVNNLPSRFSTSDHWRLHNPLAHYDDDFIEYTEYLEEDAPYEGKVNDLANADKDYWGLRRVVGFSFPLSEITSENAYEKVFGGFDQLVGK